MPLLNPRLGIDFSNYIANRTHNFTGRGWVFEAIRDWLADPNGERFFLLTGEPGSGKTAIAAQLAQFAQGGKTDPELKAGFLQAFHFCSARDSVWTDPKEFARSLALQLAQSIPEFGLALKDIGEKTNNINVDLSIGTAQNSEITGVVIQNLTLSGLTGQEAFTQVVVNPLRQIQQEDFSEPVTILVDSLDEALTHDGDSTIVSLLSKLSSNIKVKFILTSRDDGRVRNVIKGAKRLLLSDPQCIQQNRKDVEAYVRKRLIEDKGLVAELELLATDQREKHIEAITHKSDGNFLYVRFLLDAIIASEQCSIIDLGGLPQGLDKLYYESLERVISLDKKKDWFEDYAPLMGVLLAAQESLNLKQLKAFTEQGDTAISSCLNNLRQFLDKIELEEDEYRIYHQSVADFLGKRSLLIDGEKSENLYYLSAQEQHQRIVERYRPEDKSWNEVQLEKIDAYGRRHLAQHLVKADRVKELHTLLSLEKDGKNAWFKLKNDEGNIADFLADLELAWSQADEVHNGELGESIGLQCRYALIKTSINSLVEIPKVLLVALVKHGYWKPIKSLAYARQMSDPLDRFESLIALTALPELELLRQQALQLASIAAQSIQYEVDRARALIDLANKLPDVLPKALEAVQIIQDDYYRAKALAALAGKLTPALRSEAIKMAEEISSQYYRTQALTALVDEPTPTPDLSSKALKITQEAKHENYSAKTLPDSADELLPDSLPMALEVAQKIKDDSHRAQALTALTGNLLEVTSKTLEPAQATSDNLQPLPNSVTELTAELFNRALENAQAIPSYPARAQALIALVDNLTPDLLFKVLEAAQKIQDTPSRALVLIALANQLTQDAPPALLSQMMKVAQSVDREDHRAPVLAALVNKLTPDLLPTVLEEIQLIKGDHSRVLVLVALKNKLTPNLLPTALKATQEIQSESERFNALAALSICLVNSSNRFNLWKDLLHFLSHRTRSNLLSDLSALTPVIVALGGASAAAETAQAIEDVTQWWA